MRARLFFLFSRSPDLARPSLSPSLPLSLSLSQSCKHHVSSIDAQPSVAGGIIVFVTGQLLVR